MKSSSSSRVAASRKCALANFAALTLSRSHVLTLSLASCLVLLAGCAVPKEHATTRAMPKLSSDQATLMAAQLANKQATLLYNCQPFHDGQPANFTNGHWHWTELCSGDYEASVELAANGSTNRVKVYWLYDSVLPTSLPGAMEPRFRPIP